MSRRPLSEDAWTQIREAYLDGEAAHRLCDRYGLAMSTFRERAAKEKWRLSDHPLPVIDEPDDLPPVDLDAAVETAWRRMGEALRRGSAVEAARWRRLHGELKQDLETVRQNELKARQDARAREQAAARRAALGPNPTFEQAFDAKLAERRAALTARLLGDDPDSTDSLFSASAALDDRRLVEPDPGPQNHHSGHQDGGEGGGQGGP